MDVEFLTGDDKVLEMDSSDDLTECECTAPHHIYLDYCSSLLVCRQIFILTP